MSFRFLSIYNIIIPLALFYSCSSDKADGSRRDTNTAQAQPTPVMVTTAQAVSKTFNRELLCNGTLGAANNAQVGFEAAGTIETVQIKSGDFVQKGQLLANLLNQTQQMALEQAKNNLKRAEVEMTDIMLGYSAKGDTSKLSPQIMETARIKSGFTDARLALRQAEYELSKTQIVAPISGRIVDLQAKANNPTTAYEYFCHIIDEQSLQVEFSVLETELHITTPGTRVIAYPFSNEQQRCNGTITEVNRMVDKNGMVKVKAKLTNPSENFIVGMNVRVLVQKSEGNHLIIPIEGLTQRQNRDVVFVLHDSLAHWQYVEVGPRNSTEIVIHKGLNPEDKIIVSGNATIGHEAWVKEIEQ